MSPSAISPPPWSVADADPQRADEKLLALERIINGRGFVTIRETLNAVEAWLGSLPGNPYANVRQPIVHTLNLAHMMPVSAVWAGPEMNRHLKAPPLMMAETRGRRRRSASILHVGDVGHAFIVGPTGSGKSVLLSLLALQFRRFRGAQVVLFDRGRSARAAMLAMGGESVELGLEGTLSLQPLRPHRRARRDRLRAGMGDGAARPRERDDHPGRQGHRVDGAQEPRHRAQGRAHAHRPRRAACSRMPWWRRCRPTRSTAPTAACSTAPETLALTTSCTSRWSR